MGYDPPGLPLGEMMRSLWLLLLTGCEKMDDPGPLFSAVEVAVPAAASEVPEPNSDFDFPEPLVISSDDLKAGNFGDSDEPVGEAESVGQADASAEPDTVEGSESVSTELSSDEVTATTPEPAIAVVEATVANSEPPAAHFSAPGAVSSWPIRLVKTLPETNPPRAILGLPSGEELVVSPGSMVPEHGLVIISIGPNSAQIAQVSPQGDHAAISPMTLQTMY